MSKSKKYDNRRKNNRPRVLEDEPVDESVDNDAESIVDVDEDEPVAIKETVVHDLKDNERVVSCLSVGVHARATGTSTSIVKLPKNCVVRLLSGHHGMWSHVYSPDENVTGFVLTTCLKG